MNSTSYVILSDEEVMEMRMEYNPLNESGSIAALARKYKVSRETTKKILLGNSRKHLPGAWKTLGYNAVRKID